MAVLLDDLVDRLRISLNPPGLTRGNLFPLEGGDGEDDYTLALVNGFWTARSYGLFVGYRVDLNQEAIVNVADPETGDDVPEEQLQLVVMAATLTSIEARVLALPTHIRNQAGPVENEVRRSADALNQLLKAKRAEWERLVDSWLAGDPGTTSGAPLMAMVDLFRARGSAIESGLVDWVR